ncbi:MAG: LacI family DNA-binding transcriptional regulator [Oscillospiraceae bacterium]
MGKKVTIQDIADRMKTTKSTVSKAISGATDISEETRESILKCAAEMGYYISPERMHKKKNVAVLVYAIHYGTSTQFGYEIIAGIQAAATENNLGLNIISVTEDQVNTGNYDHLVIGCGYEGIFFLGFRPHVDFIDRNKGHNLPMVVLDNYIENPLVARVGCDSSDGITQIVKYLYRKGHRKIGFIGGEADSIVTIERKNAFLNNLAELGLTASSKTVKCGHFSGRGIKKITLDIAKEGVTAIVCISDVIASSAVKELEKANYRVPQDISVTGYDNLPAAEYCTPALTTINQNRLHIGKAAFYTMMQIKNGIQISSVQLHTSLVERESVADINAD